MAQQGLIQRLKSNELSAQLTSHPFFSRVNVESLSRESTEVFLGQWWHPLHYFPTFLSRTIAVLPRLEMKTAISKILYQELGEGNVEMAHERIYVRTMVAAGFSEAAVTQAVPFQETENLVKGYQGASGKDLSALGFVYGTEVADLVMVAGIGEAVRASTGVGVLPWVDIHVTQEPDHVEKVTEAVEPQWAADEAVEIERHAESMWRLWIDFFSRLDAAVSRARDVARS